jgi:hypothetical protein
METAATCARLAVVECASPGWPTLWEVTATVATGFRGSAPAATCGIAWFGAAGRRGELRGADFGGLIVTGSSSRETSFTIEPVMSAPTLLVWPPFLACDASEADPILCGSMVAVIVGGEIG